MQRTKRLMPLIGILVLFSFNARAAEDYAALAPPDALLFVGLGDFKALTDAWPKTAPGRLWADPDIVKATQDMRDEFWKEFWKGFSVAQEKKDLKPEDLLRLSGQAAFWIENLDDYKPFEIGFVAVLARTTPPGEYIERVERMIKEKVTVPVQRGKETKLGVEVYSVKWDNASLLTPEQAKSSTDKFTKHSFYYAFPEGRMIFAMDGDQSVERVLRRAQKGGDSLATTPDFAPLAKGFTPAQVRLFVPLGAAARVANHHMLGISPPPQGQAPPIDFEMLGLYDFKSYWLDARVTDKAIAYSDSLTVQPNPRGLAKALVSRQPLDPAILRAVPEKPVDFSAAGADFGPALGDLIKTVQKAAPQELAPLIGMVLAQAQMQLGVSLLDELLPALGGQIASIEIENPKDKTAAVRVIAASIKTPAPFVKAIENVKKTAPGAIEQGEAFMGATIYNFKGPENPEAENGKTTIVSTLALGNGYAVFSQDGGFARDTVRRLSGKDPHNYQDAGLFKEPATGPEGRLCSYSRVDVGAVARLVMSLVDEEYGMGDDFEGPGAPGAAGPKKPALPPKEVFEKYLGVYEKSAWFTPAGVFGRATLPNTPGAK